MHPANADDGSTWVVAPQREYPYDPRPTATNPYIPDPYDRNAGVLIVSLGVLMARHMADTPSFPHFFFDPMLHFGFTMDARLCINRFLLSPRSRGCFQKSVTAPTRWSSH